MIFDVMMMAMTVKFFVVVESIISIPFVSVSFNSVPVFLTSLIVYI